MKKAVFAFATLASVAGSALASFSEGFEGLAPGWEIQNRSVPVGANAQGWGITTGATTFAPHAGAQYAFANFQATAGVGTISAWLFSPVDTIQNGDTLKFWTRTTDGTFPDRLQVRLSTNGNSTNVGTTATSVGDFGTLLLDINPTLSGSGYPTGWTQFSITISGLGGPVSGRFAFRYFVTNGGPSGANSDFIGLDDVEFTSIPAPGALALAGLFGLAAARRRR